MKRPGALHHHLGVPEGDKIPEDKLDMAARSKNPKVRREAALARILSGMKPKKSAPHNLGRNILSKFYGSKG